MVEKGRKDSSLLRSASTTIVCFKVYEICLQMTREKVLKQIKKNGPQNIIRRRTIVSQFYAVSLAGSITVTKFKYFFNSDWARSIKVNIRDLNIVMDIGI